MDRRHALTASGLSLLGILPCVRAQPVASRIWRVGFLSGAAAQGAGRDVAVILQAALAALGYNVGRNIEWHERYADSSFERLDGLAAELLAQRVDVILTQTTPAAVAAKKASRTVPIVVVASGDLVGAGVVDSLARPGGNVTGLSFLGEALAVKQMQLLKELAPSVKRLWFVALAGVQPEVLFFRALQEQAPSVGLAVHFIAMKPELDFVGVFAEIAKNKGDAVLLGSTIINRATWKDSIGLAQRARLPAMYANGEAVDAGGLISYGIDRAEFYGQAARFVDRIFKGAKPAELPIEQPTRFRMRVNLAAAKAIALPVPQTILIRADDVLS